MRFFTPLFFITFLLMLIVGCSGGSIPTNTDIPSNETPALSDTLPEASDLPVIADAYDPMTSPLVQTETKEDTSKVWYAGVLEFDPQKGTISTYVDRENLWNFDITGFLLSSSCPGGKCIRYKVISYVNQIVEVDVTIENPTNIQGYDVRLVFTKLDGKTIMNPDGYTDLYDPPGGLPINPFIAFAKDSYFRDFPPIRGGKDTQKVYIKWPQNASSTIKYIVIASYPGNTQEPFTIYGFQQLGNLTYEGGECNLAVRVDDYQWDITEVRCDTRIFNNQIPYMVSSPEEPDKFEAKITNSNHVYPGTYPILFMAKSPNPQNASMYNIFNVVVTGPPQHPPVCDFYILPEQIWVGQTVTLYPGPGISDPDGNSIVLYEYDFYYNDGVFTAMASNTTGEPVVSPPAPYLGPNPVQIKMALRITDNGAPPMSSICTDTVWIYSNQAPVCDLKVVPTEIPSGGTVQLSPGPNCKDPDGSIILYEYDKDYDGVTFTVDYSNTTGAPVTAGPYTNPGPGPKTYTIGMRVSDNGTPQLKSICTKQITVVFNQTPNCELILSKYEINSGASVDCWPGSGTNDPDGQIVLYEYDFDYDGVTFDVNASNTNGAPVATGPIDNTTGVPVTRVIAMRVTDNGNPPAKKICTKNLIVNPIMIAPNPWRDPAVRVTPTNTDWARIDRNRMENNLCVYGNNVYVIYHGSIGGVEDFYIQRSTNGGVTFNAPQRFNAAMNCTSNVDMEFVAMDILANGWIAVGTFGYPDNCNPSYRAEPRFILCKPNASGGVDIGSPINLSRWQQGVFSTQNGDGFQCVDVAAHPTNPNICYLDVIDLDNNGGNDGPDDTSLWQIYNITTNPTATLEFCVVPPASGSPPESGTDKAHMDAVCDYNGNLHVVWCSRDLGTLYYSMVYGNTSWPFEYTTYTKVNLFGERYPEGAHVAIDNNNNAYIAYAATGIPGEIQPQEIGMLIGVGFPPTFPDPPMILNHDRTGNQVFPDIEFDQTTNDLWVAYTTFAYGPGQITFELYDAEDGWTQFQPNYWINKDDNNNQHDDQNVHLYFVSSTGTAYAIWEETNGPNAPHIYFNRTK